MAPDGKVRQVGKYHPTKDAARVAAEAAGHVVKASKEEVTGQPAAQPKPQARAAKPAAQGKLSPKQAANAKAAGQATAKRLEAAIEALRQPASADPAVATMEADVARMAAQSAQQPAGQPQTSSEAPKPKRSRSTKPKPAAPDLRPGIERAAEALVS